MPAPPSLPHYDWNICPGEGCVYGQWTARRPTTVYNTYTDSRRAIAHLRVGDKVVALTGVVITLKPGIILVNADMLGFSRGDRILTYAYLGEGNSVAWFKGRFDPDFDISFTTWPDHSGCGDSTHCKATYIDLGTKEWWAKIRMARNKVGWVNMETSDFKGACALEWP